MLFNEFTFLGIIIKEPGTIISDVILGLFCMLFFVKTRTYIVKRAKPISKFFLFMGIASILGGFAHGLYYYLGIYLHKASWIFSGLALYFLILGTTDLFENDKFRKGFIISSKFLLFIYVVLLVFSSSFMTVKIASTFVLLGIIFPIFLVDQIKKHKPNNTYVLAGILLSGLPALFHKEKLDFFYIFNMNDLSHFFLIICILLVFIGVRYRFCKVKPI